MSDGGAQWKAFGPFFDSNGARYTGIKVDVLDAGTTNNKTYWEDEDKTTAGAHPLVDSDGDGIVGAFFDGDYRFRVKDSSGVALDVAIDWDNVKVTSDTSTMWEGNFGTSYPSATAANKWQMFALVDGSDNILQIGISDGATFHKLVDANGVVSRTTTDTISIMEGIILCDATGGAYTETLPSATDLNGKVITVIKIDSSANAVTLDGAGSETINGELTWTLGAQYDSIEVISNGINWIIKTSNIASETDNWRYGLDTGSADAYAIAPSPAITAYRTGLSVYFKVVNANTIATPTLDINGLGTKIIKKEATGVALIAGDMPVGLYVLCVYNGTDFILLNPWGRETYTVGDILCASSPTERTESGDTLVKHKEITLDKGGALRIKMSLKKTGGTNCDAWIYQNGSPVGVIQETASASYAVFSQDIPGWSLGDTVEVWIARGGAGTSVEVKDFEIYTNNPPHPSETYDA